MKAFVAEWEAPPPLWERASNTGLEKAATNIPCDAVPGELKRRDFLSIMIDWMNAKLETLVGYRLCIIHFLFFYLQFESAIRIYIL
jgi:hypothetical protein